MSDDDKNNKPAPKDDNHDDQDKNKDDKNKDDAGGKKASDDDERVPKGKLDQAWKEKKDAERRAEEAERKLKEIEEADQRKRGDFEKIADEYKGKHEATSKELEDMRKARTEDEEVFTQMLEKELEGIPEDRRSLIPEDYSVRQKLKYITANREALAAAKSGKAPEKGQPDSNGKKPDDELTTLEAEREELFKKNREQRGLFGKDEQRMRELTRKIVELKNAK